MFPYFEVFGLKMYMTGIWIIFFLVSFISVSKYLCNKWHQDFYKIFYWLPIAIIIIYFMWSYIQFFLSFGIIPISWEELNILISPYGYDFHFVGILIGVIISLFIFFRNIKRDENKKIRIDILFFSSVLSLIPLGIFLVFGDNFIWKSNAGRFSVKPLTTQSELNKFGSVYPVWLFLSFMSIFVVIITSIIKKKRKRFGDGILGFVYLLLGMNIVFMFQQYPRYGIISIWWLTFDIKHYVSFFVIMFCLHLYYKWNQKNNVSV